MTVSDDAFTALTGRVAVIEKRMGINAVPAITPSPDGTVVTASNVPLVDTEGATWVITPGRALLRNGNPPTTPDYTANLISVQLINKKISHTNTAGDVYVWTPSAGSSITDLKNWVLQPGTPAPQPDPGAKINSVDKIITQMRAPNGGTLLGYEGVSYGQFRDPTVTNVGAAHMQQLTPLDFPGGHANQVQFYWIVYNFSTNQAVNCTINNVKFSQFAYRPNGTIDNLGVVTGNCGGDYFGIPGNPSYPNKTGDMQANARGMRLKPNSNRETLHGYTGRFNITDGQYVDYGVEMIANLGVWDTGQPDDRSVAGYGLQVGVDYYRSGAYLGGIVLSNFPKLKIQQDAFSVITLKDVLQSDSGSQGGHITEAQFRANPFTLS